MKRKININKINELLLEQNKSKKEFANTIDYPESNLCSALKKKQNRTLPMDYLIDVALFFNVEPIAITIPFSNNNEIVDSGATT